MIDDNEVAIDNRMRRAERQSQSSIALLLEGAESATSAAGLVTGSKTAGLIAKSLGIAKKITSELGVATLSENLEHLGDATEAALTRVELKLEAQGYRIDEIERRFDGPELLEGIKAATLQAQRTKDKKRLERMALILANGVAENDLEPESLDDMMRAAVELKEADIDLLRKIYESQNSMLSWSNLNPQNWHGNIQAIWRTFVDSGNLNSFSHLSYRSSFSRLESFGFVQRVENAGMYGVGQDLYALLLEGKRFYERLREIGVTK